MGDKELAKIMQELNVKAPVEHIVRTDWLATSINREKLGDSRRVVDLECGHKAITRNMNKAACVECQQMILNGEDYEAFRFRR